MAEKGSSLNLKTKVDIAESKARLLELKKLIKDVGGVSMAGSGKAFDTKPLTGFQQAQIALKKTLIDAQAQSLNLKNENIALSNSYKQGQISAQAYNAEQKRLKDNKRALLEAEKEARKAFKAAAGSYDEANQKLKDLGRSIKAAEGGFSSTNPVIKAQVKEYNNLNTALKKFDDDMGNHQRHIGKYQNALNGVTGDLKGLVAGYLSIQGAIALATKAFDVALSTDAIKTSLQFTLKSTDEVDLKMSDLKATADRLGLSFIPLAEGYAKFTGAAKAANFSLTDSDRIFNSVSGAASRFHLTSDQLNGSLLAIQQMISKGTVQSEELRGQLGERLPGAFSIAARAMGVTEMELGKLLQSGQVLASDLLPKLAAELDKTFSLDAATKIDSLTASTNRLSTTVDTAVQSDGIGKLFRQFIDGATNAISALDKLLQSRSFAELTGRLFTFDASKFDRYNESQDSFASSQKRATTVTDPFSSNTETARANVSKLTKAYQDAYHAYSVLFDGVKSGLFPRTTKNLEDIATYKQNAIDLFDTLTAVNNSYQEKIKGAAKGTKVLTDAQLTSIEQIRKRITELSKLPDSAIDDSVVNNRIDALKARLNNTSKAVDTELNARNTLQKKINDLHSESIKKQETADEQELTSVKLKYAAMREEAVKFNNDPKNKKLGLKVNGSTINADEAAASAVVRYRQEAKKQLEALDIQKKQYEEYEQFKNDFGAEMAEKRFGKEIVDNKTYLKKLQDEAAKIEEIPEDQRYGAEKDQLTELNKRIAAETDAERAKYGNLLKQLQSYQDKAKIITENYENDKSKIAKNPLKLNADQMAAQYKELEENYRKAISDVSVKELTESPEWELLFSNLDALTGEQIDNLIDKIQEKFASLSKIISPVDLNKIINDLRQAKDVVITRNPFFELGKAIKKIFADGSDASKKSSEQIKQDWLNLAKSTSATFKFIDDAVESCEILKDAIGEVGSTAIKSLNSIAQAGVAVSSAVVAASNAAAATAVATSAAIKAAEKASVILAVISAALIVVQAVANVFKSIFNAGDKRIEKTIQGYQDQLDALDKGFKQLERDVSRSVGESFYSDSLKEIESLNKQQVILGQQLAAERSKKHADENKISAYQDQIDEIPNKIEDIQDAITEMLVQTTFKDLSSSLSDAFTDAFANGEDSLDKLNEAFNKVIANAVKKGLELKFLQPVVDDFIKDFADYMKNNGNSALGFDFDQYKDILKTAGDQFTAGLDPFKEFFTATDSDTSSSAVNKSIKGITSDQANGMEGILRGSYDQQKQSVVQLTISNNFWGRSLEIAMSGVRHLQAIQVNTANTVTRLDATVTELQKSNKSLATIATNTTATSMRGNGLV